VSPKKISDIIDCNLKNDYPILIIFGKNSPDTTGQPPNDRLSFHVTQRLFCTTCKKCRTSEICVEMNKKRQ